MRALDQDALIAQLLAAQAEVTALKAAAIEPARKRGQSKTKTTGAPMEGAGEGSPANPVPVFDEPTDIEQDTLKRRSPRGNASTAGADAEKRQDNIRSLVAAEVAAALATVVKGKAAASPKRKKKEKKRPRSPSPTPSDGTSSDDTSSSESNGSDSDQSAASSERDTDDRVDRRRRRAKQHSSKRKVREADGERMMTVLMRTTGQLFPTSTTPFASFHQRCVETIRTLKDKGVGVGSVGGNDSMTDFMYKEKASSLDALLTERKTQPTFSPVLFARDLFAQSLGAPLFGRAWHILLLENAALKMSGYITPMAAGLALFSTNSTLALTLEDYKAFGKLMKTMATLSEATRQNPPSTREPPGGDRRAGGGGGGGGKGTSPILQALAIMS